MAVYAVGSRSVATGARLYRVNGTFQRVALVVISFPRDLNLPFPVQQASNADEADKLIATYTPSPLNKDLLPVDPLMVSRAHSLFRLFPLA